MNKSLLLAVSLAALSSCQSLSPMSSADVLVNEVTLPAAALTGPTLRVEIPSRGARASLSLVAVNGEVETWLSIDDISVSFRRGILVASNGLGFDLMGSDVKGTLGSLAGDTGEAYRRQFRFLDGDMQSFYLVAGCSMSEIGSEKVDGQLLRRFDESCRMRYTDVTNIFWLDRNGVIIRSTQWISPELGYIVTHYAG